MKVRLNKIFRFYVYNIYNMQYACDILLKIKWGDEGEAQQDIWVISGCGKVAEDFQLAKSPIPPYWQQ